MIDIFRLIIPEFNLIELVLNRIAILQTVVLLIISLHGKFMI